MKVGFYLHYPDVGKRQGEEVTLSWSKRKRTLFQGWEVRKVDLKAGYIMEPRRVPRK